MKFQQTFEKALKEQQFIRVYTEEPDNERYDGVIVCLTDDFLVLLQELDYEFDGFILLPRKQVSGYRASDVESFSHKLMTSNGDFDLNHVPEWLKQSNSYDDVFTRILAETPWLRVGWVCPSCDNIHYSVGNIKSADDDSISVVLYDKNGEIDSEMGWSMNKVFSMEFKSNFLRRFGQFIEKEQATIQ